MSWGLGLGGRGGLPPTSTPEAGQKVFVTSCAELEHAELTSSLIVLKGFGFRV